MAELEGFICPVCRLDMGTFLQLEGHFTEEHSESTASKLRSNFKSFFDRARTLGKKKKDYPVEEGAAAVSMRKEGEGAGAGPVMNVSGIDQNYWPPQEFGSFRDYMPEFKRTRDAKIASAVVETNRLVIRLEKLFRLLKEDNPKNSKQLKEVEREVVPWKPDDDEKRCTRCGRSFGVRRRKHHCRLCGDIICKQCSHFIPLTQAYVLLSGCPDYRSLAPSPPLRRLRLKLHSKRGKGAEPHGEEEEGEEDDLRTCPFCKKLIRRRLIYIQSQVKPLISALYEKLQLTMEEAEGVKPSFLEMADSLLSGDHCFTLKAGAQKREELIRLYGSIDAISKHILGLYAEDGDDPSPVALRLQRGIRVYTSNYLQENLFSLPKLPTPDQLRAIREAKEREAWERIRELERQRELLRQQEAAKGAGVMAPSKEEREGEIAEEEVDGKQGLEKLSTKVFSFKKDAGGGGGEKGEKRRLEKLLELSTRVVTFKRDAHSDGGRVGMNTPRRPQRLNSGSGWMGDSTAAGSVDSNEDPFELQKQQLVLYIQQARKANRKDEVEALEAALRDIEVTMREQHLTAMSYGFTSD